MAECPAISGWSLGIAIIHFHLQNPLEGYRRSMVPFGTAS